MASLLITATVLAAIVLTLRFGTRVTLIVPDDIRTDITDWDWGALIMVGDSANSSQDVLFTSYGAIPLTLSANPDQASMVPSWFSPHFYSLDWTAQNYEIQPQESIVTTFTLTVDVPMARNYMIDNQIHDIEVSFSIDITVSNISLPHYTLTIATTTGGTTEPVPDTYDYVQGTIASVTANADFGYEFKNYILDGSNSTDNPIDIPMYANHTVTAYFKVASTKIYVDPEFTNVAPSGRFTILVKVANIEDFYGFDVMFSWNPAILDYVSHTVKIPVETYPDGVLHDLTMIIKNDVNATAGTYWLAAATLSPDPSFNGTGIVFEMTFDVTALGTSVFDFTSVDLLDSAANMIICDVYDGYFDNTA